ncbi:MAG TPA: NRDE family protein [Thermoplasmata archaeon]|nr:NRDE family protein [Thermoplasmata archaeon]
MCTLIAVLGVVPGYPLLVAMNRDEFYDRPAVPPALRAGEPKIVMPRDERAEGTWIGVNEFGLLAAVSNRFAGQPDPRARSRGLLCLESLTHRDATVAADFVVQEAERRTYNPFNLFHADPRRVTCTSREGGATFLRDGAAGLNVLTNAGLNADDARAQRVDELLRGANFRFLDVAIRSLRTALQDHVDVGGRSICFHGDKVGTRSQTIVALSDRGWANNRIWYGEGNPCTAALEDFSAQFR